jgi:hypothetical protein
MLKSLASICVALILAAAAFSAPAQAQRHFGGGGAHFGGGGAHFGGAHFGGAGIASRSYAYRGAARGYAYRGAAHGYRYGYYGGYWPLGGWGAFASEWPYYDDYGYTSELPAYDSSVAYCMQRFRSYDPASGTYLGYDGYRHPCP